MRWHRNLHSTYKYASMCHYIECFQNTYKLIYLLNNIHTLNCGYPVQSNNHKLIYYLICFNKVFMIRVMST